MSTPTSDQVFEQQPPAPTVHPATNGTVTVEHTNGDAEVVSAELVLPGATGDIATVEQWSHEWIDFHGDHLAVRKPTQQALAGFSLASSKYVKLETKNDITGLFIANHLSPESYSRVFSRLMDPDDPDYTVETIGELMKAIVELVTDADDAAATDKTQ